MTRRAIDIGMVPSDLSSFYAWGKMVAAFTVQ